MNATHVRPVIALAVFCALASAPWNVQAESAEGTQRFAQLLKVGDAVLLRSSSNQPLYTVQLLSRKQATELETKHAQFLQASQRRDKIESQLNVERGLEKRAALFLQYEKLDAEVSDVSFSVRLVMYAYEVVHVGEDFVTLKKPGREKFVPLRSIREMYRSDVLDTTGYDRRGRGTISSPELPRRSQIRLRNTLAVEVAKIVKEYLPDANAEAVGGADSTTLTVEAGAELSRRARKLIQTLDVDWSEPTPRR